MTNQNVRRTPAPKGALSRLAHALISGVIIGATVFAGAAPAYADVDPVARGLAASAVRRGAITDCSAVSVSVPCLDLRVSNVSVFRVQTNGWVGLGNQAIANVLAPLHIKREDRGVTSADLAPTQYPIIAESEDAVIGLFSENEGGHGSGVELAEEDLGVFANQWMIGRRSTLGNGSLYFSYGTAVDYSANPQLMTIDNTVGRVSIGNTYANITGQLMVRRFGSTDPASVWSTAGSPRIATFAETNGGEGDNIFGTATDSAAVSSSLILRRAHNTLASPTAVANGDRTGVILFSAYDGTSFLNTAGIQVEVDGAVSTGTVPQRINLMTGTTTRTIRWIVKADGSFLAGTNAAYDIGNVTNAPRDVWVGRHLSSAGSAPAVTSCGTSPAIVGSDLAGEVTTGTATPTACTITFNVAYSAQPYCTVVDRSTLANLTSYTVSTSAIVLTTSAASSQKIVYQCVGA